MKTADITDERFLEVVEQLGGGAPNFRWINRSAVAEALGFPEKIVLAKARVLIDRRGTLHGCPCGCRGDFHLPCGGRYC